MPEQDCGACEKLVNCGGHLVSERAFRTLVARLLCEGVDSFKTLVDSISALVTDSETDSE